MSAITSRLLLPLLLLALPAHPANKVGNVTNTRALGFGSLVAAGGGTITISPAGARSKTGGVVLISGAAIASASYTLTESGAGKSLRWTTITLPAAAALSNGSATMALSNFVSDPPDTILGTGRTIMTVGATLTVAPNQAPGNYSGSFSVTVNYE
jgi:hypothetical protein